MITINRNLCHFGHVWPGHIIHVAECRENNVRTSNEVACYASGVSKPNYPVPAIDYYNSNKPNHIAVGNLMEWSISLETQLKFRS